MRYPETSKTQSLPDIQKANFRRVYVSGRNPDVDQATDPEDLWPVGGAWVPPTQPRVHEIVSTSVDDVGILKIQSMTTSGGNSSLIDTTKDFITEGISVGDIVINDRTKKFSVAINIFTSLIVCESVDPEPFFVAGDSYRVVTTNTLGASLICIEYLNSNMQERIGIYVLNGLTPVITGSMLRINGVFICGSSSRELNNIGNISITAQIDGTITDQIISGEGLGSTGVYTVPRGRKLFISKIYSSMKEVANAGASVSLKINIYGQSGMAGSRIVRLFDLSSAGGNHVTREFEPALVISQLSDVIIRCQSVTANNVDITANYSAFVVNNA